MTWNYDIKKKNEYICSFLVLVVLYFTTSFNNAIGLIPVTVSVTVWVGIILFAVLSNQYINRRIFIFYFIIVMLYISSALANNQELFRIIKYLLSLTAVTILFNVFPLPVIKRAYLRCIFFLSVVSLIFFRRPSD